MKAINQLIILGNEVINLYFTLQEQLWMLL